MKETKGKRTGSLLLDVSDVTTEEMLCQKLRALFELKEETTANWQKLLEDLCAEAVMPRRLRLRGWKRMRKNCPKACKRFVKLMRDYEHAPGSEPCQLHDTEAPSALSFMVPDLILLLGIPVEIVAILVMYRASFAQNYIWLVILLTLAVALLSGAGALGISSTLSAENDHWWLGKVHKRFVQVSTLVTVLLFAVAAIGFYKVVATQSAGAVEVVAFIAAAVSLFCRQVQSLVFNWKTR